MKLARFAKVSGGADFWRAAAKAAGIRLESKDVETSLSPNRDATVNSWWTALTGTLANTQAITAVSTTDIVITIQTVESQILYYLLALYVGVKTTVERCRMRVWNIASRHKFESGWRGKHATAAQKKCLFCTTGDESAQTDRCRMSSPAHPVAGRAPSAGLCDIADVYAIGTTRILIIVPDAFLRVTYRVSR